MAAELLFLGFFVCLSGGLMLTLAYATPARWFVEALLPVWALLGVPLVSLVWFMSLQLRTTGADLVSPSCVALAETLNFERVEGLTLLWRQGTLLAAVLPVIAFTILTLVRPAGRMVSGLLGLSFLVLSGSLFTLTSSILLSFVSFELLLLVSLYLLRLTAKSDRVVEAVAEMFFWTLAGSVGLFVGFSLLLVSGVTTFTAGAVLRDVPALVVCLLCLGFGVKLPIWPCFSWLLKAHVEASVEFSILLSGIVVKFGALGLQRALSLQEGGLAGFVVAACGTLAMLEASLRLLAQRDLKRIVALTTVIEVNWIGVCLGVGGETFERIAVLVLVAHSLTTTAEFFLVECIYRRYHTRDVYGIAGLAAEVPTLFSLSFLNVLTTIGFPGTSLFAGKLLFLSALAQHSLVLFFLFTSVLVLVLPLIFIRVWVPLWYGQASTQAFRHDLLNREAALLLLCVLGSIWLGVYPTSILALT